jgi:hypothetical protein
VNCYKSFFNLDFFCFSILVRLGEHDTTKEKDCDADMFCLDPVQDIDIEKTIKHVNYDSVKRINDIGLIRLKTAVDLTKNNVRTICLPTNAQVQITNIATPLRDRMLIAGLSLVYKL